jgi:hypothetical protein
MLCGAQNLPANREFRAGQDHVGTIAMNVTDSRKVRSNRSRLGWAVGEKASWA